MGNELFAIGDVETPDEDKYTIADEWMDNQVSTGANLNYTAAGRLAARSWGFEAEYNANVLTYAGGGKAPSTAIDLIGSTPFPDELSAKAAIHDLIDAHDVEFWPASL